MLVHPQYYEKKIMFWSLYLRLYNITQWSIHHLIEEVKRKHLKVHHNYYYYTMKIQWKCIILSSQQIYIIFIITKWLLGQFTRNESTMKQQKLKVLIALTLTMLYFPSFLGKYHLFHISRFECVMLLRYMKGFKWWPSIGECFTSIFVCNIHVSESYDTGIRNQMRNSRLQ